MYGEHCFLTSNAIESSSELSTNSQALGIVSGTLKDGTGSALLSAYGDYTGSVNLLITVQVHDVSGGADVGEAKYRWRTNLTASGTWEAIDITTHSASVELASGVYIRFVAGTGDDFVEGDAWTFKALSPWGLDRLLDLKRHTFWRSEDLESPNTITIAHGEAREATVIAIFDHNLTDSATVTYKANSSASWGSPPVEETLTIASPLVAYVDTHTYAYRQIEITDASNPDGYIEIGGLYIGTYSQLDGNADWSSGEDLTFIQQEQKNTAGVVHETVEAEQSVLSLSYGTISNDEIDTIKALVRTLKDPETRRAKPFFFHLFPEEAESFYLMRLTSSLPRQFLFVDVNSVSFMLEEVVRTVFT